MDAPTRGKQDILGRSMYLSAKKPRKKMPYKSMNMRIFMQKVFVDSGRGNLIMGSLCGRAESGKVSEGFWLGQLLVTQEMKVMGTNPSFVDSTIEGHEEGL